MRKVVPPLTCSRPDDLTTPSSAQVAKAAPYGWFVASYTFLLAVVVLCIHVHGTYIFVPLFDVVRHLFHLQYAIFAGALLSTVLYLLYRAPVPRLLRDILLIAVYFESLWLVFWVVVHRVFGIELGPAMIVHILMNHAPVTEMGVDPLEVVVALGVAAVVVLLLTLFTNRVASEQPHFVRKRSCILLVGLFLLIHIPVQTYFAHYVRRNNSAALAYEDCVPFPLDLECLLPGAHHRVSLRNFESSALTSQYFEHFRRTAQPRIPHPQNILWINIESLRFDAITAETMPRLWAFRDEFQLQLNADHWSNANATHFAVFSMLTGLSGYQLPALVSSGVADPFLTMLRDNGYSVRIGKKAHLESADLLGLLPSGVAAAEIGTGLERGDPLMVDQYLWDRRTSRPNPRFDFLAFDTTHWPYHFAPEDAIFQPAPPINSSSLLTRGWMHFSRSESDLVPIRNRYRNACYAADQQIGRVLEDLQKRGALQNSIVIITGDHGEEFEERGQITHSAVLNDFQGRTVLWMHFPNRPSESISVNGPTMHLDIVPTILQALGFDRDVLYTQGRSLLSPLPDRPMLSLSEQGGVAVPEYRCLVSDNYVSRWRYSPSKYLFSGVQRRDGQVVTGKRWLREVRHAYRGTADMYELLPDVSRPPREFVHSG